MAQNILTSSTWYQSLAQLLSQIGTPDFARCLANSCQLASPYDSTHITAFSRGQRPTQIYHNLPEEHAKAANAPYFAGAYLLDPFYALYQNRAPSAVYRLKDVAPDKFYSSEYYRSYYANTQLQDEAALLIEVNAGLHILISLGARDSDHVASSGQFAKLQLVTPVLMAACRQHFSNLEQAPVPTTETALESSGDSTLGTSLDLAFRNFGKDFLSTRECEVVQLILKGHSSKSIARLLEISEDTVKVHRKRFHAKLEISSQAELFSLFLEAIALVPFGSDKDPLSFYFDGARTTASQ